MQHVFFELLNAWDPRWQSTYRSLEAAVDASGDDEIIDAYGSWLRTEAGLDYLSKFGGIPDILGQIEAQRKAEAESSLPFKLSNIGKARGPQ